MLHLLTETAKEGGCVIETVVMVPEARDWMAQEDYKLRRRAVLAHDWVEQLGAERIDLVAGKAQQTCRM